jgi:3-hydroxymyristoyl/3-hydroxydecanoyl-(acyl carrier protein) dehydratase
MWQSIELHFPSDHPTVAGHFPSHPIVPGALMLDEVVAAIAGEASDSGVLIRSAKFLQPVCPGESVNLRWQSVAGGAVKFECRLVGRDSLAMMGTLEIGPVRP